MNIEAKTKLRDTIMVGPFAYHCANRGVGSDTEQIDNGRKDLEGYIKRYVEDYSGNDARFEVKHFENGSGISKHRYIIMLHDTNLMVADEMVTMIPIENPWNVPVGALS